MVCGEPELPYDRPPLSKELLAGADVDESEIGFRPARWYADHRVELILGRRATGLDAKRAQSPSSTTAASSPTRTLLIATGSAPASCPSWRGSRTSTTCGPSPTRAGCAPSFGEGARLAIVGAGFIGQEVAATARAAGAEVTIVEALPAPLGRGPGRGGRPLARWLHCRPRAWTSGSRPSSREPAATARSRSCA